MWIMYNCIECDNKESQTENLMAGHHKTPYAPSGVCGQPIWALLWACLKRRPIQSFLIKSCLCVRRPRFFLDILPDGKPTLVQITAWYYQTTSHYLSQCRPRSILPNGITRPQWVNSLRPREAIWWHRSGSTLAQVMACCLTAPSHYLNQCWLIISKV